MSITVKILVVDDDDVLRNATLRILDKAGYETLSAADGLEGLELVRAHHPALVLMDVNMDKMDGFEACRLIKANSSLSGVFVIILSGTYTDIDSRITGLEKGADDYIIRPVNDRELLARVSAILRIRSAEQSFMDSAAQWSATFDSVSESIFVTDAEFNITKCNRSSEMLFRLSSGQMVGRKCYEIVHDSDAPIAECPLKIVRECKCRQTLNYMFGDRWVETHVDPLLDAAGNYYGSIHVISDITERKNAEIALQRVNRLYSF